MILEHSCIVIAAANGQPFSNFGEQFLGQITLLYDISNAQAALSAGWPNLLIALAHDSLAVDQVQA